MIHGPLDFFGLLPSGLSIVKGVLGGSRWADVHNEIPLALIHDHGNMRAAEPVVRNCAIRAYRIGSCKFERPDIRARHSYEEFSSETTISVKEEATNCNEPCASCVETVTSVQGCVGAMLMVLFMFLCLNPESKAKYNECSLENSIS